MSPVHCIAIYCIYCNISWRYCYLKCDSHPLVARTATSLWELPQGLPHKANTHTQSPFRWQYVFYFLYFKGLLFTNKINKKKNQKDFLTNTVCLHIVVRKFTFIFLFPPLQVTNQQFLFLRAVGYVNELNNDHVSGFTEDRAARHHRRHRGSTLIRLHYERHR